MSSANGIPPATCTYDLDCPNNMICLTNVSYYQPGLFSSPCQCSSYYGFSPDAPDCGGVLQTSASLFWVSTGIMLTIMALFLLLYSLMELTRMFRHGMLHRHDPQTIGNLQVTLCAAAFMVGQAGTFSAALLPQNAYHTSSPPTGDKENDHHFVWMSFICIASVFCVTGAMTIALMWVEVASRCDQMRGHANHGLFNPKLVFGAEVAFLVLILVPIIARAPTIVLIVSFLLEIATLGTYVYGNWRISGVIKRTRAATAQSPQRSSKQVAGSNTTSGENEYNQVLRRMKVSTMVICACFTIACISSICMIIPTVVGWKEYAVAGNKNSVSMQIVAHQLLSLMVLTAVFEITRFLRESTSRKLRRKETLNVSTPSKSHSNKEAALVSSPLANGNGGRKQYTKPV